MIKIFHAWAQKGGDAVEKIENEFNGWAKKSITIKSVEMQANDTINAGEFFTDIYLLVIYEEAENQVMHEERYDGQLCLVPEGVRI